MTAELSDAFRTKREGVDFVLDTAEAALAGTRLVVLNTVGELLGVEQARERPFEIAAANWMASALVVAAHFPDALMIDAGGTTVDLIPIAGGDVVVRGRTDLDRLMTGELVYTGVLRTNLASVAAHVPVRGGWCPVASELFAISADVHLILGHIGPDEYTCPSPDGRPAAVQFARERVARLVCSDTEQLSAEEIDAIAAFLHSEQMRLIEDAARRRRRGADRARAGGAARLRRVPGPRSRRAPRRRSPRPPVERGRAGRRPGCRPGRARGRAPARPVLTVVKVGGGIAREAGEDALRALCDAIGAAGRGHRLLVVPGGGGFADAVRESDRRYGLSDRAAHRMAILAMEQFAWLLSELIPGAVRSASLDPAGPVSVWLPASAGVDEQLPASWAVTSDSIAAWAAREAGAGRLVLVKPVDGLYREWPPVGAPLPRVGVDELSGLGGVDAHLAQVLSVETWVISGRAPERLVELLERGRTVGTEVLGGGAGAAPPPS